MTTPISEGSLLGRYVRLLATYLRPQRGRVAFLAALLVGSIGLQLINPQIVRSFIDSAQTGGALGTLGRAAVLFVVVGLTQRGVALAADYVGENVGWTATNALRADLTRHCLELDLGFHKIHPPGELIDRIEGDVTALANFFSQLVVTVLGNALLIAGILVLLLREDWRLGVGLAAYTVVMFLVLGSLQNVAIGRWHRARQAGAEQLGFIEERISGTEDIRGVGAEPHVLSQLGVLAETYLKRQRSAQVFGNLTFVGTNFFVTVGYAIGLAVGAYLYEQHQATIGTAYLIVSYVGMLSLPLDNLRRQAQDLQQATASIDRVAALFRAAPGVRESPRLVLPNGPLAVELDRVSFRYADRGIASADEPPPLAEESGGVIRDLSFRLERGQVLGLLGRTGSGKTTLTRLLFRLYDPTSGAIRLDGTDLRDVSLADLRSRVGMVTQDVQLFQASVRDNLTFFGTQYGDEQIRRVLRELGLWEWIESLPRGLDTPLAAGGQGLSAGEAQLLAFARVFLKNPGLVLLDEASSRLDPATERRLEHAVDRLLRDRTGIVIAHRLRTVERADLIVILADGRVVESGPRQALAADPSSRFARLLRTGLDQLDRADLDGPDAVDDRDLAVAGEGVSEWPR